VRTHPVTGWKSLFINQAMTVGIEGLDKAESDTILNYLYGVYERSTDIQVRWHWTPGTSAIWDNRISIHSVSYDYDGERHVSGPVIKASVGFLLKADLARQGTRVSSLAEKPSYDPESKSRAETLNLPGWIGTPDISSY
jgi:hypothetical protein